MSDHLETDTANLKNGFVRPECKQEFATKSTLNQHNMLIHNSDPILAKPSSCPKCPQRSRTRYNLKKYMVVAETEPELRSPFPCTICGNRFTRRGSLRRHVRVLHNPSTQDESRPTKIHPPNQESVQPKITCPVCRKNNFSKMYDFYLHMRDSHLNDLHCDTCDCISEKRSRGCCA